MYVYEKVYVLNGKIPVLCNAICYNKIGDSMKVEKWIYKGKEIEIPILDDNEVEVNEVFEKEIEKTIDLTEKLAGLGENNE